MEYPPVLAVIPARYGSTRLPGKPLIPLLGKPMILWVYESVRKAKGIHKVLVATDDERILSVVKNHGGEGVLTRTHENGTSRVAEVAEKTVEYPYIINVQGDEPTIDPEVIHQTTQALIRNGTITTFGTPLKKGEENSPHTVKVVVDGKGFALYFSRLPIPYGEKTEKIKHVGIYGYPRHLLLQYPHLPPSPLENCEKLEQLRWLYHRFPVFVTIGSYKGVSVDTKEDIPRAEKFLRKDLKRKPAGLQ
jgi:3-deoxy-manno-octulosonate cytidylyltransferase (CMP-KDO synthetase)